MNQYEYPFTSYAQFYKMLNQINKRMDTVEGSIDVDAIQQLITDLETGDYVNQTELDTAIDDLRANLVALIEGSGDGSGDGSGVTIETVQSMIDSTLQSFSEVDLITTIKDETQDLRDDVAVIGDVKLPIQVLSAQSQAMFEIGALQGVEPLDVRETPLYDNPNEYGDILDIKSSSMGAFDSDIFFHIGLANGPAGPVFDAPQEINVTFYVEYTDDVSGKMIRRPVKGFDTMNVTISGGLGASYSEVLDPEDITYTVQISKIDLNEATTLNIDVDYVDGTGPQTQSSVYTVFDV